MRPRQPAGRLLRELERIHRSFGQALAARKRALLDALDRKSMADADSVLRLHEVLCFLRAYPDDARVLAAVRRMLAGFDRRTDLRRHAASLADTGIAGTAINYRFFGPTADWLSRSWPAALSFDREDAEAGGKLAAALPLLTDAVAAEWLRAAKPDGYEAIDRLRPAAVTDATWFLRQVAAVPGDEFTRESLADGIDASFVLRPTASTPSRTRAWIAGMPQAFQRTPLRSDRPDLRVATLQPPARVAQVDPERGAALIALARGAMVTRARDLAAFQFADPHDVFVADDGDGLAFAMMGTRPARRALLPATYAGLTLQNGVPLGYVQVDVLGPTAAISFNTFATFRGGEAAHVFARLLAAVQYVYGCTAFSIEPYQLGIGNDEGIDSGAWWFYYKFGFRPRAAATVRLARRERARLARRPPYRSSPAILRRLAKSHLFFELRPRARTPLPNVKAWCGRASAELARLDHVDPETRRNQAEAAALRRLAAGRLQGWSRCERLAFTRWSPLVLALPGLESWSARERKLLLAAIRAKGGRSELRFQAFLLQLPRLTALLLR